MLRNTLVAEDTTHLVEALRLLGAQIVSSGQDVIVTGTGGRIQTPGRELYLGNNGTAMRFLVSVAALGSGDITLTGDPRLCERPLQPLLEAIGSLGVSEHLPARRGLSLRSPSTAARFGAGGSSSGTSRAASMSPRS